MVKRCLQILVILLALSLFLFGCGRDSGSSGDSSPGETTSGGGDLGSPSSPADEPESPSASSQPPPDPSSSGSEVEAGAANDGWMLVLVNKEHTVSRELDIQLEEVGGFSVDARIADDLRAMLAAAKEDGHSLIIISGYRTVERSHILYENKVQQYKNAGYSESAARAEAAKWVAPPGTSEHHTGLAVDIISADYYQKYTDLVEAFENEPEAVWLRENAPRFGFILRFPKDKVEATGINYEPWHFRYVGRDNAPLITDSGYCLEEFLQNTAQ